MTAFVTLRPGVTIGAGVVMGVRVVGVQWARPVVEREMGRT